MSDQPIVEAATSTIMYREKVRRHAPSAPTTANLSASIEKLAKVAGISVEAANLATNEADDLPDLVSRVKEASNG